MAKQVSTIPNLNNLSAKQLDQLMEKVHVLQIDRRAGKAQELRAKWQAEAEEEGLTFSEVVGGKPQRTARNGKSNGARGTVMMKYQNPKNPSEQWSGRGRPARWLKALMDAGHKKDKYLIK